MKVNIQLKLIVLILLISFSLSAQTEETDKMIIEVFQDREIPTLMNHLVKFIWLVNAGKTESAIDELGSKTYKRLGEDSRAEWLKVAAKISSFMAEVENIELTGYQKVSSASYKVFLVGNGSSGPEFFDFDVFKFRGQWYLLAFNYNSDLKAILESVNRITPVTRLIVFEKE